MTSRLKNLPSNHLVQTVADLRAAVDGIKAAQPVGALDVQTFINQTGNSYDISRAVASATTTTFTVTFTAAVQKFAIADLTFRLFVNSMSNEVHPNMTSSTQWPQPQITAIPPSASSPLVTQWSLKLYGLAGSTNTYYLKLYVQSTDEGTVAIS